MKKCFACGQKAVIARRSVGTAFPEAFTIITVIFNSLQYFKYYQFAFVIVLVFSDVCVGLNFS